MANLEFTEYVAPRPVYGAQTGVMRGQESATQQVAIGAASAVSAAFGANTNMIEVTAVGADCRIAFGPPASVVATTSAPINRRLRAGQTYRFQVEPGQALAVIATESGADPIGAADQGLWATSDLTALRINVAASGDTALVAATASQTTRVHALRLSAAGPVIVQIKDGATVLEVFNLPGAGGSVVLDFRARPYYKGTANTALNINLSAAVQVDGRLEYVKAA